MAKIKIAVLFGGMSKDHSVSLQSAYSVLNTLSRGKYEVTPIGITRSGRWLYFPGSYEEIPDGSWENNPDCCSAVISPDAIHHGILKYLENDEISLQRVDLIFSVMHGKFGECGRIQSLCKLAGIPFLGSNPEASAACLDRIQTHLLLDKAEIRTSDYYYFERNSISELEDEIEKMEKNLPYPLFVKAASCSSSIGANVANNREELIAALKIAFSHHHKAIAEQSIKGRDIFCIVYENEGKVNASVLGEAVVNNSVVDSTNNYISRSSSLVIPAAIEEKLTDKIRKTAIKAFNVLGCSGFARVDMNVCGDEVYCAKVATMSGFTEECVLARLMEKSGFSFDEMLDILISNACDNKI